MLYTKPKNVSYTQMCIYIDEHILDEHPDDNLIFEYLWHLSYMLARNAKYFNTTENYDNFSIFFATQVFMRLKHPKLSGKDENGNVKPTHVKSCLNYMKSILYPRKVAFEQQEYSQVMSQIDDDSTEYSANYTFSDQIQETVDELDKIEFVSCLGDICLTARKTIQNIPYKSQPDVWLNIYTSCILSLLNSMTLKNKDIERINNFKREYSSNRDDLIADLYETESNNSTVLFHLDENMRDYIFVLTNKIKHAMAKDLSATFNTYIPSNSLDSNTLIIQELNGNMGYNED